MSLPVFHRVAELRRELAPRRDAGQVIAFVPTMGALHAGHARLIEAAAAASSCVVVSVFVNPLQFNDSSDFDRYPRTLEADAALCEAAGAQIVFAPSAAEMYAQPQRSFVEVEEITDRLCGAFRPGHFRGMATVVLKLFNIVQPKLAFFGEKDAQQLAVIRRMVADLNVPVEIVGVPTVREPDGLAMSSRNRHLSPEERQIAPALYEVLRGVAGELAGGAGEIAPLLAEAASQLEARGLRVEYLEVVGRDTMQPVERITGPALVAAAVWLGSTRLIDNVAC